MEASAAINAKRSNRGLKPRPVRAVVIGFPNVGKSALINRLLNKRACESAPKPGVTRNLRWLRLGGDLDLLDAPGLVLINMVLTDFCNGAQEDICAVFMLPRWLWMQSTRTPSAR